jgi:hypothetical protein
MKKYVFYLVLFLAPAIHQAGSEFRNMSNERLAHVLADPIEEEEALYSTLNLSQHGLSHEVFELALKGYLKLKSENRLDNPDILTIVDFSQTSKNKRLYVIDFEKQELLFHTLVAHGRNTGGEYAKHFSNVNGSHQSSLGFYVTKNNHMGSRVGYSMIMEGIEKGFNDNARNRQIIMHGADYATEDFINRNGRLGRSYGCPAVPPELIKPIVSTIENGTCLFIYYPDNTYLSNSPILTADFG